MEIDSKYRIARKDHACSYCNGIIKKGEKYDWSKHIYDGELYEWKAHLDCTMVASEIWDLVDPYDGMTEEDFKEGCREFCDVFICPDCEKYENDCEVSFCLSKIVEKLKTHKLERKRDSFTYLYKCVPREEK